MFGFALYKWRILAIILTSVQARFRHDKTKVLPNKIIVRLIALSIVMLLGDGE